MALDLPCGTRWGLHGAHALRAPSANPESKVLRDPSQNHQSIPA